VRAAERGVRVRMLLDDANTGGLDDVIEALAKHPNIEVRLYNPLMHRNARALDFVTEFGRVNRRMHNKSFTADNQVAIVGGRNVGNEYFEAGSEVAFRDLDAVVAGAAVRDVSREFDLYWNSASAYPAASVLQAAGSTAAAPLDERFAAAHADPEAQAYLQAVRETPLLRQIVTGDLELEWTDARLVHDDPAKTLDTEERPDFLLLTDLLQVMGRPHASFDLISPYFVPGDKGTAALVALAHEGVTLRVLTNSFASTDVAIVHAGYAKRRCELLRAGIHLYELKPSVSDAEKSARTALGSSATTRLHAKTFASDGRRIFIGSFNFDPRSAHLNTEMGLVIESADLASRLDRAFDVDVPRVAYEVRPVSGSQCMEWIERTPSGEVHYAEEPGTNAAQRGLVDFFSALSIDWLL
jgi:putative cardiolipin synthase